MSVKITVIEISRRRGVYDSPSLAEFKPWRMNGKSKWTRETVLDKAAELVRRKKELPGSAFFQLLDEPRRLPYDSNNRAETGVERVLVAVGIVRLRPTLRLGMARDISGIVEVRITGLEADNYEA